MRIFKPLVLAISVALVLPLQSFATEIPTSFQIKGAGYGHGVGMSQIGARAKAMAGEIDFTQSLITRVETLSGLDESVLKAVRDEVTLTNGAKELVEALHKQGHKVGVVSGGFIDVIEPILKQLNIDFYRANKLEIQNGKLTGKIEGKIIDRAEKLVALKEFARNEGVDLQQTVAIGDGANDLDMVETAGLGVAYNAKAALREKADTSISVPNLDALLYLMGFNRSEIEATSL